MMASLMLRILCKPQIHSRSVLLKFQKRNLHVAKYLRQEHENQLPKPQKSVYKLATPVSWKSLTVGGILGAVFLGYLYYLEEKKDMEIERAQRRSIGKGNIGGKFELVNSKGETVKSDDFLGQWVLIYFGFTHCPDICPDELEKMVAIVDKLENDHAFKIQPIFISVDPNRDTPTIVGKYCEEFSKKIIGLTGTPEQVAAACKAYRVYFSNGPKDTDSDYIVDHTIIMYLVDPDGSFVDYYGQSNTADQILGSVMMHNIKLGRINGDVSWWQTLLGPKSIESA